MPGCLGSVSVTVVGQTTCGEMDRQQLDSWEDWFKVALATSVRLESSDQEGAAFAPLNSLDTLYSHAREAARQIDQLSETEVEKYVGKDRELVLEPLVRNGFKNIS